MEIATSQIVKRGQEYLLPLDKSLVEALGIEEGTAVELHVQNRALCITPVDPERRRRFEQALKSAHDRYGDVLRRLASSDARW